MFFIPRHVNHENFIQIGQNVELQGFATNHLAWPMLQDFFKKVKCEHCFVPQ